MFSMFGRALSTLPVLTAREQGLIYSTPHSPRDVGQGYWAATAKVR